MESLDLIIFSQRHESMYLSLVKLIQKSHLILYDSWMDLDKIVTMYSEKKLL